MEVYGKITGLGPKEENQACFVGYLDCYALAMHVTCIMFLMHWFGVSESYDFSFKKSTFLKQKSLRLQKKSLISR